MSVLVMQPVLLSVCRPDQSSVSHFDCMRTSFLTIKFLIADEEILGKDGMGSFVETEIFKKLNVGFAMDEFGAEPTDEFGLAYGERASWCKYYIILMFLGALLVVLE